MAVHPYPTVRVTIGGTIKATQTWSTGFNLDIGTDFIAVADLETWLIAQRAKFVTWWNATGGPGQQNRSVCDFRELRAYYYPANAAVAAAQAQVGLATVLTGGNGSGIGIPQSCIVISLRTGRSGRSFRGRMYLPATAAQADSDMAVTLTALGNLSTATKTLFDGINATSIGATPVKMAIANKLSSMPRVTYFRIDGELDIQRRRANKITVPQFALSTLAD